MIYMRNKQTGEIKAVEPQGVEFNGMKEEVDAGGRSLWEQTGAHHTTEVVERAEANTLREQDLGKEDQEALGTVVGETGISPDAAPWAALTPGEVAQGMTPEQKQEEVTEMFSSPAEDRDADFASAAEKIAAGSDNPKLNTVAPESAGLDGLKRDELIALAEDRGVEVPSNATKAEIKAAITADEDGDGSDSDEVTS